MEAVWLWLILFALLPLIRAIVAPRRRAPIAADATTEGVWSNDPTAAATMTAATGLLDEDGGVSSRVRRRRRRPALRAPEYGDGSDGGGGGSELVDGLTRAGRLAAVRAPARSVGELRRAVLWAEILGAPRGIEG